MCLSNNTVSHELGDDVDGLRFGDDGVQANEPVMLKRLHQVRFLQESLDRHGAWLQRLHCHLRAVIVICCESMRVRKGHSLLFHLVINKEGRNDDNSWGIPVNHSRCLTGCFSKDPGICPLLFESFPFHCLLRVLGKSKPCKYTHTLFSQYWSGKIQRYHVSND